VRANALTLEGLDDLKEALKNLPPELVHEGTAIVHAHATEAARQIETSYPSTGTGNLKSHVVVDYESSEVHGLARVRSTARHAWIFEYGTAQRAWNGSTKNRKRPWSGARKNTGAMPPHKNTASFVDIAVRRRALMTNALIELVERAGLTVTGR